MKCPQCHTINPHAQKFCGECGEQLEKICPVCDAGNPQQYKFCGKCGNDLNPVGYFKIDKNGLIIDVNPSGAELLGMEETAVVGKPFTLFITEDDLAEFFTHRNTVFSNGADKACEIKIKKGDGQIDVHIECTLDGDSEAGNELLRLSVVDITENRRALEALQYRQDLEKIFISLSGEMIRCAAREIDGAIDRALKTICLFTEIDHGYICELFDNKPGIKITHEWFAPRVKHPSREFKYFQTRKFMNLFKRLRKKDRVMIADMEELPEKIQLELTRLNLPDSKSFAGFPMLFGDSLIGLVGFDSLEKRLNWPKDMTTLLKTACDAFLNIIIRQRDEAAWYRKRMDVFRAKARQAAIEKGDRPDDADGTGKVRVPVKVDALRNGHQARESHPADFTSPDEKWVFQKEAIEDLSGVLKVYEKGDKVVISCPSCIRRKDIAVSEIDEKDKTMKVKCPCGYEFFVVLELRFAFRKQVNFEGYFTLKKSGKIDSDSVSKWGSAWIRNISKSGIGFVATGRNDIARGDELKVKFNLDNTSKSTINKSVVVKSIHGDYLACQFTETDKYDVTLGFYLM